VEVGDLHRRARRLRRHWAKTFLKRRQSTDAAYRSAVVVWLRRCRGIA
jgi:hypothetical protein